MTLGFSTMGLGTFVQKYVITADIGDTPNDSTDSQTPAIVVAGAAIGAHLTPADSGDYWPTDSLVASISHPSGVDTAHTKTYVDGVALAQKFSSITATGAVVRARSAATGAGHKWVTYACAVDGRCDSVITHFNSKVISTFSLDDSLPPAAATGGFGGVGPLPIQPENLRGCPVNSGDPDIAIVSPYSRVAGQGNGIAFVAPYYLGNASITITAITIDHPPGSPYVCSDPAYYGYVAPQDFNYNWWGTDFYPQLFHTYPYSDSTLLAMEATDTTSLALAFSGNEGLRAPGPSAPDDAHRWSIFAGLRRHVARLLRSPAAPHLATTAFADLGAVGRFYPNPGAINPNSYTVTLNGTTIISGGNVTSAGASAGVTKLDLSALQSDFAITSTSSLLNQFSGDTLNPGPNGGWNELIASIADSTGHWSSQRVRFVQGNPAGPGVQGVVLTPQRNFEHMRTADCAAFGLFQCGGLFVAEAIPGFVTRDRDRGLHLVYRSASQRAPTVVPLQMDVSGYQAMPDSFHARANVNSAYTPTLFRYAGLYGVPNGSVNAQPLYPNATAHRIMGVEVPAPSTGDAFIDSLRTEVTSFYSGPSSTRTDTALQPIVQLYLTRPQSTRFGPGWQLAEQSRLILNAVWPGDLATAILVSGDGSYAVYHSALPILKPGQRWQAPSGSTAQLVYLATADAGAHYVLYRDDGSSVGYRGDGFELWVRDLTGRQTTFTYVSGDSTKLVFLTDPTGARYQFDYDRSDSTALVSRIRMRAANPIDTATVATMVYNANRQLQRLILWKGVGQADTSTFGYLTGAPGAYLDSLTDPRSTSANPIRTIVSYDARLYTPVQLTEPSMATGTVPTIYFRDEWRRGVPRLGYGRDSLVGGTIVQHDGEMERLVTPDQYRGTYVTTLGHPTDFRVDPFGGPTFVDRISDGSLAYGGGFYVPGSAADDIRDMTRDSAGRVTKIVRGREELAGLADSVMYRYNPVYQRVDQVIRTTLEWKPGSTRTLDTLAFAYDSVSLGAALGQRCYRLRVSLGAFGDSTRYSYPSSGAQRCAVDTVTAPGNVTTRFTYGTFTSTDPAGTRPLTATDPGGAVTSFVYDSASGNAKVASGHGETTTMYYASFGRPDSLKDGAGTLTQFKYDRFGRVIDQKTGSGLTTPTTRTIYLPGGLVDHVDVFAGMGEDFTTPANADSVQTTHYYYNRPGMVDSIITPGGRSPTKVARKQGFLRDPGGNPYITYPGNGNMVYHGYDWAERQNYVELPATDVHRSLDGETFAPDTTISKYIEGYLVNGTYLHGGQYNQYTYDGKGQLETGQAIDAWRNDTIATTYRTYSPAGLLVRESQTYSGKLVVDRTYQYDRRGQRLVDADTVYGKNGGSVSSESAGTIKYVYDSLTGRLKSDTALVDSAGTVFPWAVTSYVYDHAGRDSVRTLRLGAASGLGTSLTTLTLYDGTTGRTSLLQTTSPAGSYQFSAPTYDAAGRLTGFSGTEPHIGSVTESYVYDPAGTGRLLETHRNFGSFSRSTAYSYDVYGNRLTDLSSSTVSGENVGCNGDVGQSTFGGDSRLLRKYTAGCGSVVTFYQDQTGNRLMELDSTVNSPNEAYSGYRQTYTAGNQLYYSLNATSVAGTYDANWHLYDYAGRRVQTLYQQSVGNWFPTPNFASGNITYYIYDGDEVALTALKTGTTGFLLRQRYLSEGTDGAIAARVRNSSSGAQEALGLITDYQGTTLESIKLDGTEETNSTLLSRDAFGKLEANSGVAAGTAEVGTGFAGGSTPNSTGGFTYFRNRWYDPNTGRFLSQDPIGLGGGINLYAYAGNAPTMFSDPFGLCKWHEMTCWDDKILALGANGSALKRYASATASLLLELTGATAVDQHAQAAASGSKLAMAALVVDIGANAIPAGGDAINIGEKAFAHILARHAAESAAENASKFAAGEDIRALISAAEGAPTAAARGGRLARTVDAGRIIGTDRAAGATSKYTVITDQANNLVTAHPGEP